MSSADVHAVLHKVAAASKPLRDPTWLPSALASAVDAFAGVHSTASAVTESLSSAKRRRVGGEAGALSTASASASASSSSSSSSSGDAGAVQQEQDVAMVATATTASAAAAAAVGAGAGSTIPATPANSAARPRCAYCGTPDAPDCCAGCLAADYCGRPCQKAAWPTHKWECQRADSVAKAAASIDLTPTPYTAPEELRARYVAAMRDEAYDEMEGLLAENAALADVGPEFRVVTDGASGRKRLLKVAADLSTLPSLAVHWASSILARQDTASMDVMRAAMTGPAGECTVVCGARARADGRGRASGRGDAMGGGACMHACATHRATRGRLRARRAARWGTACLAAGRAPDCRCARAALPSAPRTTPHPRPTPAAALVVPRLASLTGARVQTRPT